MPFQHRKKKLRLIRLRRLNRKCASASVGSSRHSSESDTSPNVSEPSMSTPKSTGSERLRDLKDKVLLPNKDWCDHSPETFEKLVFVKLCSFGDKVQVTHVLTVQEDLACCLMVANHPVKLELHENLKHFANPVNHVNLSALLAKLDTLHVCCGQPDKHFVRMVVAKKGSIVGHEGKLSAFIDNELVMLDGTVYQQTIRSGDCEIISPYTKCSKCSAYRNNLRTMYNRWSKKQSIEPATSSSSESSSKYTNDRYLNTPEKLGKINTLRKRAQSAEAQNAKLRHQICQITEHHGETVDEDLSTQLKDIMSNNNEIIQKTYPEGSFARLFWEEQLKAASVSNTSQIRWHPVIIKWCLNLKLLSSSTYHALRTSGFVKLPSERTLYDYTHYFKLKTGFQDEVNSQLVDEIEKLNVKECQKFVGLLVDEMKVKEGLVYSKHTGQITGFTNLDDISQQLLELEKKSDHPPVATYMLAIMVRGIFFKLDFPYAHFGSTGVTGEQLFPLVWEAIRKLEACGIKVIFVTADGASPNRKFFRMHSSGETSRYQYKARNPYSNDERYVYFIADPPHLMKTVRNCWSHSGYQGTRLMKVDGQTIEWAHLQDLYEKVTQMRSHSGGLSLIPKLTREHVKLTSYSRMRVDLATQVLSKSVHDALSYYGKQNTKATEKFVLMFDRFFDCLNSRSPREWFCKKKPDLKPYRSTQDARFEWLQKDFLAYLDDWQSYADSFKELTVTERNRMTLSRETLEGLHITVNSFVEMAKYLLALDDDMCLLSERISQDPVENYFGQQRARGGRNENPTLEQCIKNASALRIQKSQALNPVRGNCSRKKRLFNGKDIIDETPLLKRKRT